MGCGPGNSFAGKDSLRSCHLVACLKAATMKRGNDMSANEANSSEAYARSLYLSNLLREPAIAAATDSLRLPAGSRGLDVGCGIGLHTALLAKAVGREGHVTGVDVQPDFLARARNIAEESGLESQIVFREGSVLELPFDNSTFDWVWSADTIWPGPS
ncbi:MAG: hypothetical protein DRP45_06435, partial [Candidatus Zixiibacteriota bacterium]